MQRRRVDPFKSGLVTAIVMVVAMVVVFVGGMPAGPQIPLPWNHTSTLHVILANSDALESHASVEIAGVKVGEVHDVSGTSDGHSLVTMTIDSRYFDVHQDAQIALRPHGLFGPKYIDLIPGSSAAPQVADGATIAINRTVQPVDLDQILKALQAPEAQNLRTAIVQFGIAASGRGNDANHLIASADHLALALDTPLQALDQVGPDLSNMLVQDESFNASFAQTPLDQLVANSNTTLEALAQNEQHLESLLQHADSVLTTLDQSLNGQGGSIRAILQEAPTTIDELDQFNKLLGLFGANLTGKDSSMPNDTDVTNGIIAAIENPKSAFASSDPCTPGQNHCPADGREHYLRVQVFNLAGSDNVTGARKTGGTAIPSCFLQILDGLPGNPTVPCGGQTAPAGTTVGVPSANVAGGSSMISMLQLLTA